MPRRHHAPELDLFPFLSVLACTIGTLILMVVVISTSSLQKDRSNVQILARETAQGEKTPRYVECLARGVLIHPQRTLVPTAQLDSPTAAFTKLVNQIKSRPSEYIIVAVRPDGFDCFEKARAVVEQAGVAIGFEPFNADWKLCLKQPCQ
ncbi:hypothetical protein [Synechococcus sp. PCC 6312]|uniref:hypothetical protein n=1 Tax=Synechococcus sp. (strain ATCC 27167 / PCC 6312) TaxID=195253 RepID=UPI00029ED8A6|nr:hypothetical protein [Synechococcus sp. PCC 6312]AFY59317.1 hypothetical protein Syn6312_0062 [Synechococcus sp. PCC 6312]